MYSIDIDHMKVSDRIYAILVRTALNSMGREPALERLERIVEPANINGPALADLIDEAAAVMGVSMEEDKSEPNSLVASIKPAIADFLHVVDGKKFVTGISPEFAEFIHECYVKCLQSE